MQLKALREEEVHAKTQRVFQSENKRLTEVVDRQLGELEHAHELIATLQHNARATTETGAQVELAVLAALTGPTEAQSSTLASLSNTAVSSVASGTVDPRTAASQTTETVQSSHNTARGPPSEAQVQVGVAGSVKVPQARDVHSIEMVYEVTLSNGHITHEVAGTSVLGSGNPTSSNT